MQRLRRGLSAAGAAVICLVTPMNSQALETAERAPTRAPARRTPSDATVTAIQPQGGAAPAAVVTTVAVPGGLSSTAQSAFASPETLFSAASRAVLVTRRLDGTRVLTSPARFLNVLVLTSDAEGGASMRCVSTLEASVLLAPEGRAPQSGAEKE